MPRGTSRLDEAKLQGRLWTPNMLRRAILIGWWDASDTSTITCDGSGNVSQWNDKGPLASHQLQGTSGLRPAYSPNTGPRGQSIITTAAKYMAASVSASTFTAKGVFISAWVKTGSTTSFNSAPLTRASAQYPAPLDRYNAEVWMGNGTFSNTQTVGQTHLGTSPLITKWNVMSDEFVASPIGYTSYINGVSISTGSSLTYLDAGTSVDLFSRSDHVTTMNGAIGEGIALCNHTTRERQLVEGFIAWHWGIALVGSHPFANRPPLIGD